MKKNILKIVIDPGFDFMKIIINGKNYKVPSTALAITEDEIKKMYALGQVKNNRILSKHQSGVIYVVGEEARRILQGNGNEKIRKEYDKINSSSMEDMGRFKTEIFRAQLFGSLGFALFNYAKDTETSLEAIKDMEIYLGLALPHSYVDEGSEILQGILLGKHSYEVKVGSESANIEFEVKEKHTLAISQTIAALLSLSSDDEGNMIEEKQAVYEKLPALVIDGGYYTLGIVDVQEGYIITDKSESNTNFAMLNINKKLVERIKKETGKTDIEDYNIEQRILTRPIIRCTNEKDEVVEYDIRIWKEEITKEACEELIDYLNKKFDNLNDYEQICIAGGTGTSYAQHLEKYLSEKRKHIKFTEINATLGGEELEPIFAIAVGMYKFISYQINQLED